MVLTMRSGKAARLIDRMVREGQYQFESAKLRTIRVRGKSRIVYGYSLTDQIVHGAVAYALQQAIDPSISPSVYSYRRGMSWWTAVSHLARHVRDHYDSRPDKWQRGLYVIKRDIHSYGESIPVHAGSRIWELLHTVAASDLGRKHLSAFPWGLIERAVRPEITSDESYPYRMLYGIPDGQPISGVLLNLYLVDVDRDFDQVPGGLYARYSDDLLFVHPDLKVIQEMDRLLCRRLDALRLSMSCEKAQNLYLTGAGRHPTSWDGGEGTTHVPFLGMRVSASGTVSLDRAKARGLLRDVESRAFLAAKAVRDHDQDVRGKAICGVINQVLDSETPLFRQHSASFVRMIVTDRPQLAQLDYWIARIVLRAVTGDHTVKAFRRVPYHKIREDWGLISLVRARNRWGRE